MDNMMDEHFKTNPDHLGVVVTKSLVESLFG